eukprot:scaffold11429_cov109-Isochrysis_galbana.AAC.5
MEHSAGGNGPSAPPPRNASPGNAKPGSASSGSESCGCATPPSKIGMRLGPSPRNRAVTAARRTPAAAGGTGPGLVVVCGAALAAGSTKAGSAWSGAAPVARGIRFGCVAGEVAAAADTHSA